MEGLGLIVSVAIIVVLALAAMVALGRVFYRRRRTERLRHKFGTEYDHTIQTAVNQSRAESELTKREKLGKALKIHPLTREEGNRFSDAWQELQTRFVDEPGEAITNAEVLLGKVIEAMGYPTGDFEQRVTYLSVNYPQAARSYRGAHAITKDIRHHETTTEDMRQAMVSYREVLDDLFETGEIKVAESRRIKI
jgi:C4-dicarboxylate-specific signal transduction histidine kinase